MSPPIEDQRVTGPATRKAIDGLVHRLLLTYLTTREQLAIPLQPMAWIILGVAEDGLPVALRVAVPTPAAVEAVGDRLVFVTVSEGDYIRTTTKSGGATVQSYIYANAGSAEGYPGLETRIVAMVHGPGGRMWSSAKPPDGEPWPRPAIDAPESYLPMGHALPAPARAAEA